MAKPLLIIGNKNYSSWSLRPYMALACAGIPFDEKLVPFGEPKFGKAIRKFSKAAQVPILLHNDLVIWDSIAILEYIAETWPEKNLWPKNKAARTMARSMCAEMHSGFRNLRNACPMNLRRPPKPAPGMNDAVMKDVARLEYIWADAQKRFGKGGPFLFGKFSNADAMFAPVLSRIETFAVPVSKATRAYMNVVLNTAAFKTWKAAALNEKWVFAEDEVD
jgi:glutathione S-transferase